MLLAHPAVLRNLLERYEALQALAHSATPHPDLHRKLQDVSYTLCISTSTRDIDAALIAARTQTRWKPSAARTPTFAPSRHQTLAPSP
ncbi:DUF5133 domain-containing protein [Streptomyces sp. NPDC006733]|uniref:DUF5133 domain-containing protein n=1 Tax=Streptomyces sp. NPDC006733 TaxID=3155460 RepID=UPI0033D67A06